MFSSWMNGATSKVQERAITLASTCRLPLSCSEMKYALAAGALVVALALVACSDDGVSGALADVCTETAEAATDLISVDEPGNGDDISTPIRVSGEIVPLDGRFWISVVDAGGRHIIDFPGRIADSEEFVPFELEVPFSVFDDTPACLWVYRLNVDDPADALRIPIDLVPEQESDAE